MLAALLNFAFSALPFLPRCTESELVVQEALDNILEKKKLTTVIIAHRLSTIRSCDIINVLVYGELLESGTHDELMEKGGYYKKLVEKQDGTKNNSESNSGQNSRNNSSSDLVGLANASLTTSMPTEGMPGVPHIQFRNVKFAYPTRPKKLVFDGFNLDIEQGSTVALVGPSGKSMISQHLLRNDYSLVAHVCFLAFVQEVESQLRWGFWNGFMIPSKGQYLTMDTTFAR